MNGKNLVQVSFLTWTGVKGKGECKPLPKSSLQLRPQAVSDHLPRATGTNLQHLLQHGFRTSAWSDSLQQKLHDWIMTFSAQFSSQFVVRHHSTVLVMEQVKGKLHNVEDWKVAAHKWPVCWQIFGHPRKRSERNWTFETRSWPNRDFFSRVAPSSSHFQVVQWGRVVHHNNDKTTQTPQLTLEGRWLHFPRGPIRKFHKTEGDLFCKRCAWTKEYAFWTRFHLLFSVFLSWTRHW